MTNRSTLNPVEFFGASEEYLEEATDVLAARSELLSSADTSLSPNEPGLVFRDERMKRLVTVAESIAQTPSTVLLSGESGTGKEVLARFIHRKSPRASGEFVAVNCAALPPTLLESELFGHRKGAFTGASSDHEGVFERADGGTLLLDEVSEMSLELQAKLLRVIQERQVLPVGGKRPVSVDFRLIATTNRELESYVEQGHFRQDLFYRLNVFPLEVPPLRNRRGDIEPITRLFLARFIEAFGRSTKFITEEAMRKLEGHDWPGNVRELVNVVERGVVFSGENRVIEAHHLVLDNKVSFLSNDEGDPGQGPNGDWSRDVSGLVSFKAGEVALTDVRRNIILETLRKFDGNRTRTAEALGVSVRTIRNRIRDYESRGFPIPE